MTAFANGVAERWVGSARRDGFYHMIALDEAHLRHLARECMAYHHADRTHDGLGKDTPLRANIDETVLLVVITEQGENRNQCEEQRNLSSFSHGLARRGT